MRKLSLLFALVFVSLVHQLHAQENCLTTPDVRARRGQNIELPFMLNNTSSITAFQFTLQLPEGLTLVEGSARLEASRRADHVLTATAMTGGNRYNILSYSPTNKALKGQSGTLFTLTLKAANSLLDGEEYRPTISDLVLTLPSGANAATGYQCGSITLADYPDLVLSDIRVDGSRYAPGDEMSVSYVVRNQGSGALKAGWREYLYLTGEGAEGQWESALVGTNQLDLDDQELGAGSTVSRQVTLTLPQTIGVDGQVWAEVLLLPYATAGESESAQANNRQRGEAPITLSRQLFCSLTRSRLLEGQAESNTRLTLTRSGYRSQAQSFDLSGSGDSRLTLPTSITIPAGQSSVIVPLAVADDQQLNADSLFSLTVSGANYEPVVCQLTIVDDEYPQLTLTAAKTQLAEGESVELTLSAEQAPAADLALNMRCDVEKRLELPAHLVLPAGQREVRFVVKAIDDNIPSLDLQPTITVAAQGYHSGSCQLLLIDDDMPAIEMTLTPHTLSEDMGLLAIHGHLKRTTNTSSRVTINLSDDSQGDIYYHTNRLELAPGVTDIDFTLGILDNQQVDGERYVTIRASVYMSACSCSASGTSAGEVRQTIHILDNDGPALTLTASRSMMLEGDPAPTSLTITRNTDTAEELKVYLRSDYDEGVSYPKWAVIAAGQQSVIVEVKAQANEVQDDDRTIIFTVEAADYNAGVCWLMLTDQTLPDAVVAEVTIDNESITLGDKVSLRALVCNQGIGVLPEQTRIAVLVDGEQYGMLYTQQAVAPGAQEQVSGVLQKQPAVGSHELTMSVNPERKERELLYNNNVSASLPFVVRAPFELTLTTDKQLYKTGEEIICRGQASGKFEPGEQIEIYVIDTNGRFTVIDTLRADGSYETTYRPYEKQSGHLTLGVCYPGEASTAAMQEVDVYGLRRTSQDYLKCDILLGESFTMNVGLMNPGLTPLTGITASIVSKPDHYDITCEGMASLAAGASGNLRLKIKASERSVGDDWEPVMLRITSREGASLAVTLYCYANYPQAKLIPSIARIDATMTKGKVRQYPLFFVNQGLGESGPISMILPQWIKASVPTQLPSIAAGDTVQVVLLMSPTDEMQLNAARTGSIAVNCENGEGFQLPFNIIPGSDERGMLEVEVCDEYTYYTAEAPRVNGAHVSVYHPATGALVAEGFTDGQGRFQTELAEGYYRVCVAEDHHETYQNHHVINAGKTEHVTINISYHAVSVTWNVVETEVVDEYSIVSTFEYEAHVPAPVVKMSLPERIDGDNMAVGETCLVYMTLTNLGLIRADNNTIVLPDNTPEWEFEALDHNEPFSIEPQQTVSVPIRITRVADIQRGEGVVSRLGAARNSNLVEDFNSCMAGMKDRYQWLCGEDIKNNEAAERMALKFCAAAATVSQILQIFGGGGGIGGHGGGGGGGGYGGSDYSGLLSTDNRGICDTCVAQRAEKLIDLLVGMTPLGTLNDAMSTSIDAAKLEQYRQSGYIIKEVVKNAGDQLAGEFVPGYDAGQKIYKIYKITEICKGSGNGGNGGNSHGTGDNTGGNPKPPIFKAQSPRNANSENSWIQEFDEVAKSYLAYYTQADSLVTLLFGDRHWFYEWDAEKHDFIQYVGSLPDGYMPGAAELMKVKPSSVSYEQMRSLIQHVNVDDPTPYLEKIEQVNDSLETFQRLAEEHGHGNMADYFMAALDTYKQHFDESSSSVCSSITLQFSQRMTMTRQAFRGTLSVYNGHGTIPLQHARLELIVTDPSGKEATSHEFQINLEKLEGFEGQQALDGEWSLGADASGMATILFIPSRYAAPDVPVNWSFGGRFTYLDPYTGLEVTRTLAPVTLEVRPSPLLNLTYFMQRDVYADDPLTEEIEQSQEAEFALLLRNVGNGDATNVNMVTDQPQIIDNEKGLLIDFEILRALVNGEEKALALGQSVASNFGTIPSQSSLYAQWMFTSTLLGHFRSYDIEATHLTSYGNEDLSLLDEVSVHEMIHSFGIPMDNGTELHAWLVNDILDGEDQPDMVYLSDGDIQPLHIGTSATWHRVSDNEYWLTVTPSMAGWNYVTLADPTDGKQRIISVSRQSDGRLLGTSSAWQTWCRMPDGKDPIHENNLHFADMFDGADAVVYRLMFEPRPDLLLEVESIEGIEQDVPVYTESVTEAVVRFNKPIDPATFTSADLSLRCQGVKLDLSWVTISQVDSRTFRLNLSSRTGRSGYYVLGISTAGITDLEGFVGKRDASTSWIQQLSSEGIDAATADWQMIEGNLYNSQGILIQGGLTGLPDTEMMADLPAGIYVYSFEYGGKRFERKIFKRNP